MVPILVESVFRTITIAVVVSREDLHKVDAISFALQRAEACMRDDKIQDRESAALLWNLLILLCRQNGVSHTKSRLPHSSAQNRAHQSEYHHSFE